MVVENEDLFRQIYNEVLPTFEEQLALATGNAHFILYNYHLFHCVRGVFEKPFFMRVFIEQHLQRSE